MAASAHKSTTPLLPENSAELSGDGLLRLVRRAICANQGVRDHYYYYSNEHYEDVNKIVQEFLQDQTMVDKDVVAKLDVAVRQFENTINEGLLRAIEAQFDYLGCVFSGRSEKAPRMAVILFHADVLSQYDQADVMSMPVLDIVRRPAHGFMPEPRPMNGNTGLQNVTESRSHWLGSDLPDLVRQGQYLNPRINPNRAQEYVYSPSEAGDDVSWCNLWTEFDADDPESVMSCYKSTLIVPIMFGGVLEESENLPRKILGYLCMDHVMPHFFREETDVDIGYIFADALSQFLLYRLILQNSPALIDARGIIQKSSEGEGKC